MMLSRPIRAVFLAGAMLIFSAEAQTLFTGEVTGTVTDPSGAVVSGAMVDLTNQSTGTHTSVNSGTTGEFRFSLLVPGNYTLAVSATGFEARSQPVAIDLGQSSNLRIELGVQATKQDVSVAEEVPLLQSNNANLTTTFDQQQIENLPDPGGDISVFAFTAPGVTINTAAGDGNFTAFGLPSISNVFTMNGVNITDPYSSLNPTGTTGLTLGANEIQEAAVVSNGYLGQYGSLAGANVNYITKSGSNAFHGNALWNWNGRALNANDFFNNTNGVPRPFAISNIWADSLGGPVKKNKLFFYFDNEGTRYDLPSSGQVYVPTPAFANYVLTHLAASNPAAVPLYTTAFNLYAGTPGAARATPLSLTPSVRGGCGHLSDPVFGVTQACTAGFQDTVGSPNREWLLSARADYNVTSSDHFYLRFHTDHSSVLEPDPINSAFNETANYPSYGAELGYTKVISPHSVNTLLLAASDASYIIQVGNNASATFPTGITLSDGDLTPLASEVATPVSGDKPRQWQLVDDFSLVHGRHTLRAGVSARENFISTYFYSAVTGGHLAFTNMNDLVNGSLTDGSTYQQAFATVGAENVSYYTTGYYFQDEWRVTPKLMVTLALRLDRTSDPDCRGGCYSEVTGQVAFDTIAHTASTPYNQTIQTGLPYAFGNVEPIIPEPRIGLAYSLTSSTVLRGGIGLFADANAENAADRFITNAPTVSIFTTSSGLVAPPGTSKSIFSILQNSESAFLNGFANGATLAQLQAQVQAFAPPNLFTISNSVRTPKYAEWNIELQQAFTQRFLLSVNYVGNHGYDEWIQALGQNGYSPKGYAGLPTTAPDPRFGVITALYNGGWSNYDGLVSSFRWRINSQFSGVFSYTWSHALDTCSNDCVPEPFDSVDYRFQFNPLNLQSLNYSNADYDVRHSLNANYVYTVPSTGLGSSRVLKAVLGNWTAAGSFFFHTGFPFSIVDPLALAPFRNFSGKIVQPVMADFLGGSSYPSCTTPNVPCYSASEFASAAGQEDFGNIPRNSFRGPGYFDTDLNLHKAVAVAEKYSLIVGASFYNILNHPNFAAPVNTTTLGTFGEILSTVSAPTSAYGREAGSAVSGRVIQTQIKFSF